MVETQPVTIATRAGARSKQASPWQPGSAVERRPVARATGADYRLIVSQGCHRRGATVVRFTTGAVDGSSVNLTRLEEVEIRSKGRSCTRNLKMIIQKGENKIQKGEITLKENHKYSYRCTLV